MVVTLTPVTTCAAWSRSTCTRWPESPHPFEFIAAAAGCFFVRLLWAAGGAWLVGVRVNYIALALHAVSPSRPATLEHELEGVDVARELHRYKHLQVWIVVPLLLLVLAVRQLLNQAEQGPR
jgi:hypothetical protein